MPVALAGRDLIGTAQTGTGQTAAFVLPMLQRLLDGPRGRAPMAGLSVERFAAGRMALIGEAAHVFPPIGAQGLNLGD